MRILWFCNVPTFDVWSLDRSENACDGGWIGSLKDAIVSKDPSLELGVAFPSQQLTESFLLNGVTYFPILERQPKVPRVLNRLRHITDRDSVLSCSVDIVHKYNPDVVHFFGSERIFGKIVPDIRIPSVVHLQGLLTVVSRMWFRSIPFGRMIRHQSPLDLLLGRGYLHDYLRQKKAAAREREILGGCTCVMGRTDWDRRVASLLAPRATYYPCDETLRQEFWQTAWQPQERKRKVLFATLRDAFYKGLETLLESFELICRRTDKEVNLRIAGISEDSRVASLARRSSADAAPGGVVSFLGPINAREVANELAEADVFVHPSHVDNSPNSVCEAMLVGTPVVSTNAGGIPSLVTDSVDGLLVQDGDPYAMAGAILDMLNDRNLAVALSQRARARAKERHDPDRIVERVTYIYRALMKDAASLTRPT